MAVCETEDRHVQEGLCRGRRAGAVHLLTLGLRGFRTFAPGPPRVF